MLAACPRRVRSRRQGTLDRCELLEQPWLVAGREHERRLLVDARELEHRRGRRAPVAQRRYAALAGGADPALELAVDQPPGLERQRERRAPRGARRSLADRPRQARDGAEQHEQRLLAGAIDLDVPAPGGGALEPTRDARVDGDVLELLEHLDEQVGVMLDGRETERARPDHRGPAVLAGRRARAPAVRARPRRASSARRGGRGGTRRRSPSSLPPPALPRGRSSASTRSACACRARRATSVSRIRPPRARIRSTRRTVSSSSGRSARPIAGSSVAPGCSSSAATESGAASVAKLSHQFSSARARSRRHSRRLRLRRTRSIARPSAGSTSGAAGRASKSRTSASAWSGSIGMHHARSSGSQRRPGIARRSRRRRSS